jgi:glycerol transport system ATP-binding protein
VPVQKRNVAMVYQQFINYPNITVYENIASPLRVAGVAGPRSIAASRRPPSPAADPDAEAHAAELSGGQQQRTAIARALIKDSDLILLDEPLANLDYKLREEMRDELPKLFAGRDASSSTPPPSRPRRCSSAATRRPCSRARDPVRPDLGYLPRADDIVTARVFSDPPINTAPVTKIAAARS